jgi:TolB-like protein/tRNA A-37 threonylcarbamoyl transferase component Bud32/tetratricopeptide (TPR) repeat protein
MNTATSIETGRVLAERYRVERQAGEGGMAIVFEATDLKHGRRVALKVLRPEIATHLAHERFRREIQLAATLSHPNIVPMYESGEGDGLLFYVMPFVTGETLSARLARDGPFPIEDALRITREVGRALSYAHAAGIVHRDLKPGNIMLSDSVAVVTDFGIARLVGDAAQQQLTQTGLVIGTPAYMSPEQAMGDAAAVSPASDQYSLACVLFEMLSGRTPFQGSSALATLALHNSGAIPDVRQLRDGIPQGVAEALEIALAKDPSNRFPSVDAFVRALGGDTTGATALRKASPRRRRRWMAIGAGLVVVAIVAGWFVVQRGRAGTAVTTPVVAVLTFDHQGPPEEKYLTDGITDELATRIGDVNGIRVVTRASAMQYDLRKQSLREIAAQLGVTHILTGSVRTDRRPDGTRLILVSPRLVNVATGAELWSDHITTSVGAGEVFAVQERIALNVARVLDVALSPEATAALASLPTKDLDAYQAFLRGNLHASQYLVRAEQEQAIADLTEAVRLDPKFALAQARLAQVQGGFLRVYGGTPDRLAAFKAAVDRAVALAPDLPQSRIALGMWYAYGAGDRARGLKEFESVKARQPNNADLFVQIGRLNRSAGDNISAVANFERASALDPRSTTDLFEDAVSLFLLRRMSEGKRCLERALAISPDWVPARIGITQFLLFEGKTDEVYQKMGELAEVPGIVQQLIGDPLYRFRWEIGLPPVYEQRLERLSIGDARVDSAEFYRAKGRLYARHGDHGRERAYFDSVLAVLEPRRRVSPVAQFTHVDLGFAYSVVGRTAEARAYADSARALGGLKVDAFRGWFASWEIARLYARLGAADEAFAVLNELGAANYAAFVRADPAFASLRGDPRFAALIANAP